jgi:ATP-dependent RNA helicase RhlE
VRELAHAVLQNPALVEVARRNAPAELVTHSVIKVDKEQKRDLLLHLFASHGWHQVLVFCRTKHGSDALARKLEQAGIRTAALHGNKSQNARTRALADFKAGKLAALVATDIAARGLDIDSLPRVVNFELPNVPEDYVHRIGRTGRAGASGEALSLVSSDERIQLRDIERLLKREIESSVLPGFEPQHTHAVPRPSAGRPPAHKPAPARSRSGGGARPGAPRPARAGGGGSKPASHHSGQRHR